MKKLFCMLAAALCFSANAQNINFLNNTICESVFMPDYQYVNEYVQGGGHNYYISYSLDAHSGSFSGYNFPYGSDNNPMYIYIDTTGNKVEKFYFREKNTDIYTGMDFEGMYISRGLWGDYSDDHDVMIGEQLPYEEAAFQCLTEDKSGERE